MPMPPTRATTIIKPIKKSPICENGPLGPFEVPSGYVVVIGVVIGEVVVIGVVIGEVVVIGIWILGVIVNVYHAAPVGAPSSTITINE